MFLSLPQLSDWGDFKYVDVSKHCLVFQPSVDTATCLLLWKVWKLSHCCLTAVSLVLQWYWHTWDPLHQQFDSLYCQVLCRQSIFTASFPPLFYFFFKWHKTFVQTSFKNINKLEPLRLTWQKTHYQMSWRRTNFSLFFSFFRKRFTNEMSLQNIKERGEKKLLRHTKYYQKTSRLVWYSSTLSK